MAVTSSPNRVSRTCSPATCPRSGSPSRSSARGMPEPRSGPTGACPLLDIAPYPPIRVRPAPATPGRPCPYGSVVRRRAPRHSPQGAPLAGAWLLAGTRPRNRGEPRKHGASQETGGSAGPGRQRLHHWGAEVRQVERFEEQIPVGELTLGHIRRERAGHQDHRHTGPPGADRAPEIEAGEPGERNVGDHDVDGGFP